MTCLHNKKETGDVLSNMSYKENIDDDVITSDDKSDKPNKKCTGAYKEVIKNNTVKASCFLIMLKKYNIYI